MPGVLFEHRDWTEDWGVPVLRTRVIQVYEVRDGLVTYQVHQRGRHTFHNASPARVSLKTFREFFSEGLAQLKAKQEALGFTDPMNSWSERRRGRENRSIPHSYGGEGRTFVD